MTKREVLEAAAKGEGCLGRADDDEPVFVLRAKDKLATEAIGEWIDRAHFYGVNTKKIHAALDDISAMNDWQLRNGTKLPD